MTQARWKSYPLWVSIASLVLLVLQVTGVHVVPESYNLIANSVLVILVGFGVINNPTDPNKI